MLQVLSEFVHGSNILASVANYYSLGDWVAAQGDNDAHRLYYINVLPKH